ncbi:hypothetical protein ACHAWU_008675 [Discostella pseudostelligera]|uniref:PROP1-like PPR domain-containing protein n=1 Tax=Discostella pseudostelligera TaxID=259834 RepID=A0ABD3MAU0_9STRA
MRGSAILIITLYCGSNVGVDAFHLHPRLGLPSSSSPPRRCLGGRHQQQQLMTVARRHHPGRYRHATQRPLNNETRHDISHISSKSSQSWKHRRRVRSKAILNSFENIEKRQDTKEGVINLLNSMVNDILEGQVSNDNLDWDLGATGNKQRQLQSDSSNLHINLSRNIHPRDATSIIRLLGRNNAHDAMLQFCRRYCRDILSFNSSSQSFSTVDENIGDGDEMESISNSDVVDAIRFAYTAAIAACARPPQRYHHESLEPKYRTKSFLLSLLDEMEHGYSNTTTTPSTPKNDTAYDDSHNSLLPHSILPNSYTLSAILLGIDDVTESMTVLEDFEKKYGSRDEEGAILTVQVYNVVIASCSKDSSSSSSSRSNSRRNGIGWQRALSILQRMRRSGPQPNEETYSMILQSCAVHGQMKVAFSLLDEIRKSSSTPMTTGFYLPLLKVCAKAGDHLKARLIIDMMENDNASAMTTEIMNLYLLSLAKHKDMQTHAMEVLQKMIDGPSTLVPPPDIVSFNNVLSAYANAGDYDGAQSLLDQMKYGLFDVSPDVVSYNTVMSCADPCSTLSLIQEMKLTRRNREGVIIPNSVTYVNAITQCRKASLNGDYDEAQSAYEIAMHLLDLASEENYGKGIELNVFVYSASIWMAEAVGDYQTAVKLLQEMKCRPNNICYDGVISVLSKQGMHREALYFYYEMRKAHLSATRKTYQMLVYAIDNSRDNELSCQKKAALLDGVLSVMPVEDRSVQIGGCLFEAMIKYHGNATESSSYQAARIAFDSIIGPVDDACLCAMLRVCSSVKPVKWNEAIVLIHSSDIVNDARVPGMVSSRALSLAVTACAKDDQWEEALNLIELYGCQIDHGNRASKSIGQQRGIVSVGAINSVIRACGRRSRPDIAVQILNDMPLRYAVEPVELSYRLAIIACNQAEHRERKNGAPIGSGFKWWECALSLLRRMKEDGVKPSLQTISSVVSSCEAAGEWQRAIGVLKSMPHFSSLLGRESMQEDDSHERPNLYCLNAAISACEKGGAWLEALQLYENILSMQNTNNSVRPNFVTVNSLLIALENAQQHDLSGSIYRDAVREKIVSPWKYRHDTDGNLRKMMDLHQFSKPMAKIAVRNVMDTLLSSKGKQFDGDAVFIVGKGKRSDDRPVLLPAILQLLQDEYGISATVDEQNTGRIRVTNDAIASLLEKKRWKI